MAYGAILKPETQHGLYFVPTLIAAGARVKVQESAFFVVYDFEYVRVTRYEEAANRGIFQKHL